MLPPSVTDLYAASARWSIIAIAGVALFLAGYFHARHVAAGETASAELRTALAYADEIVARQQIADELADELAARRAAQAARDQTITREIIHYVQTTPAIDRCRLPGAFRMLHDAAATGNPTAAETGPLAAADADPVEDTALLETIGHNYTACRRAIAQLEGWQRRYTALEAHHAETH